VRVSATLAVLVDGGKMRDGSGGHLHGAAEAISPLPLPAGRTGVFSGKGVQQIQKEQNNE